MAEITTSIPGGPNVLQVDLAQLNAVIAGVVTQVVRQIMVVGDPNNALAQANVVGSAPSGNEYGVAAMIVYSAQLSKIADVLTDIKTELQNLATLQGGQPVTPTQ